MKNKMTKDIVPEGFTMSLALVDALPVFFFAGSMFLIWQRFSSKLFLLGALLCLIGGIGKVLWKVIVVLKKKNVWTLFVQMRLFMPLGFLLMICSLIANADRIGFDEIIRACIRFPSIMCFVAGIVGMVLMTACALSLQQRCKSELGRTIDQWDGSGRIFPWYFVYVMRAEINIDILIGAMEL